MTYYEDSIAFESIFPHVHADAYLEYSEIIVKQAISERYSLAMELLLKEEPGLMFPISKYKVYSLLSILSRYMGNNDQTEYYAKLAEVNANAQTSGLRYHKYLGVVEKRDKELDNLLKKNGG